jgi:hypothetical protein
MFDWKLHFENFVDDFRALSFERKLVRAMLVLVAVSLTIAVTASLAELLFLRGTQTVNIADVPGKAETALRPEQHPIEMLPAKLPGVETKARQAMPGSSTFAAEAIYAPEDEDQMVSNPFTVYVGITYYSSAAQAAEAVQRRLEARGDGIQQLEIGSLKAQGGHGREGSSYLIGWAKGNYAIEMDGALKAKSLRKEPMIALTTSIAEQVNNSAVRVLKEGEKQPDG